MQETKEDHQIGIYIATSLVVGTMIGSGIFMIPANLAKIGGLSIIGWLISGAGAILIAFLFARLSKTVKGSGGPYVYPKEGFGKFVGFLSGWGYWASIVVSTAAYGIVFTGYFYVFFPELESYPLMNLIIPLTVIWLLTWLNSKGVKAGGRMQLITTILKILPLFALILGGVFLFEFDNFQPMNVTGESDLVAIGMAVSLTLFAFLGIESATIPAENVKEPEKNIPRATIWGTIITIFIYISVSAVVMGMMGLSTLAESSAPMADAAFFIWGESGRILVSLGALVSVLGAMNALILFQAQLPMVMARDKLFPPIFKELSRNDFPVKGLIISSLLVTVIVLGNNSENLTDLFALLILLSTFLNLITYLFSSMSEVLILIKLRVPGWQKKLMPAFLISIPTFAFSLWAVHGSGKDVVFYGFLTLMLGTPFYVYSIIKSSK